MQIHEIVAGALFDFAGRLTTLPTPLTVWTGAEAPLLLSVLGEWAADRGLDLDQADVAGWQKSLAEPPKSSRRLPPAEELKCRIAEALGYDLDRHDITKVVITIEAGGMNPITVQVTDMTKPNYEDDVVETFKEWTLNPTLGDEKGHPFAYWRPEEGGYKLAKEEEAADDRAVR